jgi:hypothetical protein
MSVALTVYSNANRKALSAAFAEPDQAANLPAEQWVGSATEKPDLSL